MFQPRLIHQLIIRDEPLNRRIGEPGLVAKVNFIAPDVDIRRGEQLEQLVQNIPDEIVRFVLAGMEGKVSPTPFSTARNLGIGTADSGGMAWHVKLWHHHDVPCLGIGHNLTDIILGIEARRSPSIVPIAHSALGCEFGIAFYLNAPARFVRQMPMEDIHLQGGHDVQILQNLFLSEEMAAFIHHEASPTIAGSVINAARSHLSLPCTEHLQKRLAGAEKPCPT